MASAIDPMAAACDRAQHRRAEQHRFLGFGKRDGQAGGIRHDLPDQRTPACAAADHHEVAGDPVRSKRIHHIGKTVGEATQSRHEQPLHRADIGIEIQTGDDRTRVRIGER